MASTLEMNVNNLLYCAFAVGTTDEILTAPTLFPTPLTPKNPLAVNRLSSRSLTM